MTPTAQAAYKLLGGSVEALNAIGRGLANAGGIDHRAAMRFLHDLLIAVTAAPLGTPIRVAGHDDLPTELKARAAAQILGAVHAVAATLPPAETKVETVQVNGGNDLELTGDLVVPYGIVYFAA